jgi:RNA polymerase sigma-70 factor (ECF subfamily)
MDSRQEQEIRKLARGIKASDEEAFSKLFHRTYPKLVRFAGHYTKAKASAEDVVQESFVSLWENRKNIEPERSMIAYLFQIVRNRSLNYLRDHKPKNVSIDDLPGGLADTDKTAPEITSSRDEPAEKMTAWIEQLPVRQREAVRLSRFEGFDHEEIAGIMNISPRTVNNHIVAGLKTLRGNWNDYKKSKTGLTQK